MIGSLETRLHRRTLLHVHWSDSRRAAGQATDWGGGWTHHGGLVLVDHHFFSFRNYAGARDKTNNSKAAGT